MVKRLRSFRLFAAVVCAAALFAVSTVPAQSPLATSNQVEFQETLKAPLDARLRSYKPVGRLSGKIRAAGADTVETVVQYWIEGFKKLYPEVEVTMDAKTITPGVLSLVDGSADLVPIAREPLAKEEAAFEQKLGRPPFAVEVGGGAFRMPGKSPAIVFYVNKANPINKLTLAQLDSILSGARKRGYKEEILTWGQLGATGDFAKAPIHIYGIKRPNGIPHFVELRVSLGGEMRDTTRDLVSDNNTRVLYKVAQAVDDDPYGLGYGSLVHVKPNSRVLALAEKDGSPFVQPTFKNVLSRRYPLARPIYIYLARIPGQPVNPLIHEFLKYVLSREGQQAVQREGILLPLSADASKRELDKLK
jgi:phosphate transport system substrate-binding protein